MLARMVRSVRVLFLRLSAGISASFQQSFFDLSNVF